MILTTNRRATETTASASIEMAAPRLSRPVLPICFILMVVYWGGLRSTSSRPERNGKRGRGWSLARLTRRTNPEYQSIGNSQKRGKRRAEV